MIFTELRLPCTPRSFDLNYIIGIAFGLQLTWPTLSPNSVPLPINLLLADLAVGYKYRQWWGAYKRTEKSHTGRSEACVCGREERHEQEGWWEAEERNSVGPPKT